MKNNRVMVLALGLLISSAAALSAQTSGSLTLQGTVPGIMEITVSAYANASSLDLAEAVSALPVASVTERSNKKAGYKVSVESLNAKEAGSVSAFFKSADPGNSDVLTYSISYNGQPVVLSGGAAEVSSVNGKTNAGGVSKVVSISYNGTVEFMYEDSYTDTLTFTIEAN
jgi:hypothetical protein